MKNRGKLINGYMWCREYLLIDALKENAKLRKALDLMQEPEACKSFSEWIIQETIDKPKKLREIAEDAIEDLKNYAHDEGPERLMVSHRGYKQALKEVE